MFLIKTKNNPNANYLTNKPTCQSGILKAILKLLSKNYPVRTIQHVILKQKHVDKEGNQTQLRQRKKKLPTI
jgi:hypothetical protein